MKRASDANATEVDKAWRQAVKVAVSQGFKTEVIAEAAGVSVARIYQIRDDRR